MSFKAKASAAPKGPRGGSYLTLFDQIVRGLGFHGYLICLSSFFWIPMRYGRRGQGLGRGNAYKLLAGLLLRSCR